MPNPNNHWLYSDQLGQSQPRMMTFVREENNDPTFLELEATESTILPPSTSKLLKENISTTYT